MRQIPWLSALLCAGLLCGPAAAHQGAAESPGKADAPAATPLAGEGTRDARTYFTDTELLNQEGKRLRFYSDVLQDRVVLINVIYTSCKDACPLITRKLGEVRDKLGERFGKDVIFVSLTSDPQRDSPQALKKFAKQQAADNPGWVFLTGRKENVDRVLAKLGQLSQNVEEHSTLLIAGNVAAKRWSKIRPDAPPAAIAERLRLLADGGSAAGSASGKAAGGQ